MMKVLYEVGATAEGGVNGHVKSTDGLVDLEIAVPRELAGNGGAANPEMLLAAGYAACFDNALHYVAGKQKLELEGSRVTATVGIGEDEEAGGFRLAAKIAVRVTGLAPEDARRLVDEAHAMCPYSKAVKGNMEVEVSLVD